MTMDAPTINVEVTDEDALALDILGLDTGTLAAPCYQNWRAPPFGRDDNKYHMRR